MSPDSTEQRRISKKVRALIDRYGVYRVGRPINDSLEVIAAAQAAKSLSEKLGADPTRTWPFGGNHHG